MTFEDSLINELFPCCGTVINGQCSECGTRYEFAPNPAEFVPANDPSDWL